MHLILTPMRRDDRLTASVAGDMLTLNGVQLDFAPLPAGAVLPRAAIGCGWIAGDVTRSSEGVLVVPLILPHGPIPWPAPPAALAVLYPEPVTTIGDGPVTLPTWTEEAAE